ncbi:hypothetical protein ACWGQ5_43860 [Streptomyces sp. NPDC055722]
MHEVRIGLGERDMRRNLWSRGVITLICAGASAGIWWSHPQRVAAQERWGWISGVATFWVVLICYLINQARGRTVLTAESIRLASYVKRKTIPWRDVIRFEERQHTNRGGTFWYVRVHRAQGRPLTLPGLFTSGRKDRAFKENVATLHKYWSVVRSAQDEGVGRGD